MCFGSTLCNRISAWRDIGAPETVLRWISEGVELPFNAEPEPFEIPNRPLSLKHKHFVDKEISKLVLSGVNEHVTERPHCVSPLGVVPKKSGKLRLITDLRRLNESCEPDSFKNEDIRTVKELIQPQDHLVTIDLESGFQHVPISPGHRKFLGIQWRNSYYVWCTLPFGLNASPYFFNKTVRPVIKYLRQQGLRVVVFVDDFILMAQPDIIYKHMQLLLETLKRLGWHVNFDKCDLEPSTSKVFVGYVVMSDGPQGQPWIKVPQARVRKAKRDILRLLKTGRATARALARIAGQCVSMTACILPAKLLLRNLYRLLSTRQYWAQVLVLDPPTVKDLTWWVSTLSEWNGAPISTKPVEAQVTTDASGLGWGAVYQGMEAKGVWEPHISQCSSNFRELLTTLLAIMSFLPYLRHKRVQLVTDNISTVAYINLLGGPSPALSCLATAIWATALEHGIELTATHLAGKRNIHADALSRDPSPYEWMLHPGLFKWLDRLWGPHTCDRFASLATHQIQHYNSLYWDPLSKGVDALAQPDWGSHNNFVNPPFWMIPKVLGVIKRQKAVATIIAPHWPAQYWYPTLQSMAVTQPVRLPRSGRTVCSVGSRPEPLKNRKWDIYVWRVSGKTALGERDGRRELSDSFPCAGLSPPGPSIIDS
jgi:hypothetical protein